MSQKPIYVQLEANEDVPSIRDRLSFIRGKRVLLIWPEEGTALKRKLELVLVQREAKRRALQIALVTHDPDIIQNAKELNISTFETVGASEKGRWKRGRTKVFLPREHKPEDEPEPEALMKVASRVRSPRRRLPRFQSLLLRLIILVILIGAIGTAAYAALPGATVEITIARQFIEAETTIIADPRILEVNIDTGEVPAKIFQVDVETVGTRATTGQQPLDELLATGRVTFFNRTDQSVVIPADTRVSTRGGSQILFRTVEEITVPAGEGQFAEVDIEAIAGSSPESGNVPGNMITTIINPLLDEKVKVDNLSPTTGGQQRVVSIVTQADKDGLEQTLRGELQSLAYTQMQARLSDTEFIIIETVRITDERSDWKTFSHNVGDVSNELTLSMRVTVEAMVVNDSAVREITLSRLSRKVSTGRIIQQDTVTHTRGAVTSVQQSYHVEFTASSSAWVNGEIPIARLQERLAGRPIDEAYAILLSETDLQENTQPTITVWPEGFGQMPIIPIRITFQVGYGP